MKALSIDKVSDDVLRTLRLHRLSILVQQILSISKDNLSDLAKIVFEICDIAGLTPVLSEVKKSDISSEIDELKHQIELLNIRLDDYSLSSTKNRCLSLDKFTARNRSISSSRQSRNKNFSWSYFRFDEKSKKCTGFYNFSNFAKQFPVTTSSVTEDNSKCATRLFIED